MAYLRLHGVPQGSVLGPILFLLYTQPLSQIIDRRSVSNSEFADDSQLYGSVPREQLDSLLSSTQSCALQLTALAYDSAVRCLLEDLIPPTGYLQIIMSEV